MRIAYCTNVRLPNERAHGHQIAHVVAAMQKLDHEVTVFAPFRKNDYKTEHSMNIAYLGTFDPIDHPLLPKVIQLPLLNRALKRHMRNSIKKDDFDVIYTRTPALLPALLERGIPVIIELHAIPSRGLLPLLNKAACVVTLTSLMRDALITMDIDQTKMIVEGDAVDLDRFTSLSDHAAIRSQYHIPSDAPLIGYVGQLQSMHLSKGIPELLSALKILSERGVDFQSVIAGGPEQVRQYFVSTLSPELQQKIHFPGFVSPDDVPSLMHACDVLVYPAPASDHSFYTRDTSPLKVLEYMAAHRPIVAANIPPLKDLLDDTTALLCRPGDANALADALMQSLKDRDASQAKADAAFASVQSKTWTKRMQRILDRVTLTQQ